MTESLRYLLNHAKEIKYNNISKFKNKENTVEIFSH
jgi:hypothetical protein